MELYHISLYAVEKTMRNQFREPEERDHPERPVPTVTRPSRTTRMRLRLSAGLYELANALDPAIPAPRQAAGHQH